MTQIARGCFVVFVSNLKITIQLYSVYELFMLCIPRKAITIAYRPYNYI